LKNIENLQKSNPNRPKIDRKSILGVEKEGLGHFSPFFGHPFPIAIFRCNFEKISGPLGGVKPSKTLGVLIENKVAKGSALARYSNFQVKF